MTLLYYVVNPENPENEVWSWIPRYVQINVDMESTNPDIVIFDHQTNFPVDPMTVLDVTGRVSGEVQLFEELTQLQKYELGYEFLPFDNEYELTEDLALPWIHYYTRRLKPMFDVLNANGFYCSTRDLKCCGTCAHYEISLEHEEYLFYTSQMYEQLVENECEGPLYLGHNIKPENRKRVLEILSRYFHVEWPEDRAITLTRKPQCDHWKLIRQGVKAAPYVKHWIHEANKPGSAGFLAGLESMNEMF